MGFYKKLKINKINNLNLKRTCFLKIILTTLRNLMMNKKKVSLKNICMKEKDKLLKLD